MIKNKLEGIYIITCKSNKKVYIGQSGNLTARWRQHKWELKNKNHYNIHLQNAFNNLGIEQFEYSILEECSFEDRDEREKHWITHYNSTNSEFGYNLEAGGHANKTVSDETKAKMSVSRLGKKHSLESIKKMSLSKIGKKVSLETRKKLSNFNKGKKHSEETKSKCAEASRNKIWTEEAKMKISKLKKGNTYCVGHKHTDESKTKMSIAQRGSNNPMYGKKITEEHINILRQINKGNHYAQGNTNRKGAILSEETKAKMSESAKNRLPPSGETRKKMSESIKGKTKGRITSEETKQKISNSKKGKPSNRKGVTLSEETKRKISETKLKNKGA